MDHAKLVIPALAKFHALGIAMKVKKPKYFEVLKQQAKTFSPEILKNFEQMFLMGFENIYKQVPILVEHHDRCVASGAAISTHWLKMPDEPWSTIVHLDLWINNILFRKNSKGEVTSVKFIDFQNYMFAHPLRDLIFFIGLNLASNISDANFDQLSDLYYDMFISKLKEMNRDVSPFSKSAFLEQSYEVAKIEYAHCAIMINVMTAEPRQIEFDMEKVDELLSLTEIAKQLHAMMGPTYFDKIKELTERWVKKEWL